MSDAAPDPLADALRLRASDADRERVAGLLRDAFAEGRLSPVEHEERLSQVYAATTYADLVPVLHDLPVPPGVLAVPGAGQVVAVTGNAGVVPASNEGGLVVVDPSRLAQAVGNSVAILSGVERKGRWVVPPTSNAIAMMGGVVYDFTGAILTSQETVVQVVAIMGGVDVTVPEGIDVRMDVVGIMGGSNGPSDTPPAGAPILRFTGVAIMGGVDVKRPKRSKRDKRDAKDREIES